MGAGEEQLKNSSAYFANRECRYYPCHAEAKDWENFNCLFCYCPLYMLSDCPGTPVRRRLPSGSEYKDCTGCTFPHRPENYDAVKEHLKKAFFT